MEQNQMPNQAPSQTQEKSGGSGALIGSIIIVVILIIGGIYLFQNSLKERTKMQNIDNTQDTAANIDAELNSMNLDDLDSEI